MTWNLLFNWFNFGFNRNIDFSESLCYDADLHDEDLNILKNCNCIMLLLFNKFLAKTKEHPPNQLTESDYRVTQVTKAEATSTG